MTAWDELPAEKRRELESAIRKAVEELAATDLNAAEAGFQREELATPYEESLLDLAPPRVEAHVRDLFREAYRREMGRQAADHDDVVTDVYRAEVVGLFPAPAIARMRQLERLNVKLPPEVAASWLAAVRPCRPVALEIEGRLTDEMVDAIVGNPSLGPSPKLDVGSGNPTPPGVSAAGALRLAAFFTRLTWLRLVQVPMPMALARAIATGPSRETLRGISFPGSRFDGEALGLFASLPRLELLTLTGGRLGQRDCDPLHASGAFPSLKTLVIDAELGDETLAHLASSPVAGRLERLDVDGTGFTAEGAKVLEPLVARGVVDASALRPRS